MKLYTNRGAKQTNSWWNLHFESVSIERDRLDGRWFNENESNKREYSGKWVIHERVAVESMERINEQAI